MLAGTTVVAVAAARRRTAPAGCRALSAAWADGACPAGARPIGVPWLGCVFAPTATQNKHQNNNHNLGVGDISITVCTLVS